MSTQDFTVDIVEVICSGIDAVLKANQEAGRYVYVTWPNWNKDSDSTNPASDYSAAVELSDSLYMDLFGYRSGNPVAVLPYVSQAIYRDTLGRMSDDQLAVMDLVKLQEVCEASLKSGRPVEVEAIRLIMREAGDTVGRAFLIATARHLLHAFDGRISGRPFPDLMAVVQRAIVWCFDRSHVLDDYERDAGIEPKELIPYPAKAALTFIEHELGTRYPELAPAPQEAAVTLQGDLQNEIALAAH